QIALSHAGGQLREFHREVQQGNFPWSQSRRAVILLHRLPLFVALDHRPEVFLVSFHSIQAAIDFGDDGGNQHPLPPIDAARGVHDLTIQVEPTTRRLRSERLYLGDVWNNTRPLTGLPVQFSEFARSGLIGNRLHPCHAHSFHSTYLKRGSMISLVTVVVSR